MPMNNRLLVPQKLPLLLDYAPGAAAAYSLRSLSNSYTGPVVTVRRSTDNAERDFTATEVSDNTLAAWCGGGDGYVKTWHDQSLNNRDATQTTTGYQPKIVASGVVILKSGKPAVQFDGTDDRLPVNALASAISGQDVAQSRIVVCAPASIKEMHPFGVGRSTSNTPLYTVAFAPTGQIIVNVRDDTNTEKFDYRGSYTATQSLLFYSSTGVLGTVSLDGAAFSAIDVDVGNITLNTATIGAFTRVATGGFFDGTISELIIYPSDMTALRTRIEADMAWYY